MSSEQVKTYLSFSVLLFALLLLLGLFFLNIPRENKDLVNILLGAVVGWSGSVISFYFGSSDREHRKDIK